MYKEISRQDLQSGDVIMRRNGRVQIYIKELSGFIGTACNDFLADLQDNLTDYETAYDDIVAVRRPKSILDCTFRAFENKQGELVFGEKPPTIEMTEEEVSKILGYDVKVVTDRK